MISPSSNRHISRYTPQSPTPDSPPETPPSGTTAQLDKLPGYASPPFGMVLPERLTPDGSPDSASGQSSTFVTPANSARPSGAEGSVRVAGDDVDEDEDGDDRMCTPGGFRRLDRVVAHGEGAGLGADAAMDADVLAAFQAKQERALEMLRSDSESSTWSHLDLHPFPTATPSRAHAHPHGLEPAFTPPHAGARSYSHLIEDDNMPISPAADGKKEPSIKPAPVGLGLGGTFEKKHYPDPNLHSRGRAAHVPVQAFPVHGFTSFPHTGKAAVAYQEKAVSSSPAIGVGVALAKKEKFTDSVGYWLGLYFMFNLGLTLFNKIVLVSFPFPYTLTGLHALSGCAGCYIALERGSFTPARLTSRENLILAAFSVLYTINIAVSNISLQLVTVPFHQVVRASTPLFTIIVSAVLLRTRFTAGKLVSLLPVVAGVGFATYGDYYFTAWGLILTLLGTFLAALKTVVTNLIQTGGGGRLKLHPLDLLMRMSPLAFIQCVVYAWYTGELERVRVYGATQMTLGKAIALLVNGIIACGLNIVSFTANKKAGALTMTVSANCKQVMTIALAVVLFDLNITPTNGIGILLTLIGGGWYGWVEFTEKRKRAVKTVRS